jgi:hypothetical protein
MYSNQHIRAARYTFASYPLADKNSMIWTSMIATKGVLEAKLLIVRIRIWPDPELFCRIGTGMILSDPIPGPGLYPSFFGMYDYIYSTCTLYALL